MFENTLKKRFKNYYHFPIHTFFVFLFCILALFNGKSQSEYHKFRAIEERVKYFNPDSLFYYSENIDTTNFSGKIIHHWSKGRAYFWKSNYTNAYSELEKTQKYIEILNNQLLKAELYLDLASALSMIEQNGKALSYYLEANGIISIKGNDEQKSKAAIDLAEMYRKIAEFEKAYQILYKIKPIAEKNLYSQARCYNRIAALHSETGKNDSSLYYSYKALEIANQLKEPNLIATSENEIGYMLRIQRKFDESLPHFYKADSLWRSVGMLRYAINALHHISVIYNTTKDYKKSLEITQFAYQLIKDKNWYQTEINILDDLRNVHANLNNKDSVIFYKILAIEAGNRWKDQQYETNTKMVEILFTQKENEQIIRVKNILLEKEKIEKESIEYERRNLIFFTFLIVFLLVIIFIYAFKQRDYKIKLSKENKEKEIKNHQLADALIANEALVQEISHRVKNNLAVLSGLLRMQATRSDNQDLKNELNVSILRIDSIATIHKNLYDKGNDAKVNLDVAIKDLSNNILHAMGVNPEVCLILELEKCELEIAQAVTFCLILNEVITNSCKYGEINESKKLNIKLSNHQDLIKCSISDQGKGFAEENLDKNHKSLGLYLIKMLSKQLKAEISWKKTEKLFKFSIQFKKHE